MTTIGYGDISPVAPAERIYVIFNSLIAGGIFAYSMGIIGGIF